MLGRTFKVLKEFRIDFSPIPPENQLGLVVDLPACTILVLRDCHTEYLCFLSCANVRILRWSQSSARTPFALATLKSLHVFTFNLPCLQELYISIAPYSGRDSLIQLVFRDAREQGVWQDIKSVKVEVEFTFMTKASHFFDQTIADQQHYQKWWETFTVTMKNSKPMVIVRESM